MDEGSKRKAKAVTVVPELAMVAGWLPWLKKTSPTPVGQAVAPIVGVGIGGLGV